MRSKARLSQGDERGCCQANLSSGGEIASAHGERGRQPSAPIVFRRSLRGRTKRSGYRQRLSLEQRRILGQVEPRPQRATILAGEPSLGVPAEVPPTGILGELDAPGRRIRTAPFGIRERHGAAKGTAPESAESHGGQHGERCQNPERDTAGSDPSQDARGEQCRKAEGVVPATGRI